MRGPERNLRSVGCFYTKKNGQWEAIFFNNISLGWAIGLIDPVQGKRELRDPRAFGREPAGQLSRRNSGT